MHGLTVWLQLSRKRRIVELDDSEPLLVPQKKLRKTKSLRPPKADEIQETQQGEAQWPSVTVA
jgi:hypothetical protein